MRRKGHFAGSRRFLSVYDKEAVKKKILGGRLCKHAPLKTFGEANGGEANGGEAARRSRPEPREGERETGHRLEKRKPRRKGYSGS